MDIAEKQKEKDVYERLSACSIKAKKKKKIEQSSTMIIQWGACIPTSPAANQPRDLGQVAWCLLWVAAGSGTATQAQG